MPTIEVDYDDLQSLLGRELPKSTEELDEILCYVKGEVTFFDGSEIHIEIGDGNRPDLWSIEGLARTLRGFLGIEKGLKRYIVVAKSGVEVYVDPRLKNIRPYIACAVVKKPQLGNVVIRELMHLQDKLDQTYGRKRRKASIGVYDFGFIAPPLRYGVAKPTEMRFAPLDFEEEMTLEEILKRHPKGVEYGHIIHGHAVWPIFLDSEEKVLSFPPIINSNDLGRVTEDTRDVLIEVTGTAYETVLNTLTTVALSLADRRGQIYSATIHHPYVGMKEVETPRLKTQTMKIDVGYVNKVVGMKFKPKEVATLLKRGRYGIVDMKEDCVTVEVPCYRVDVMHPIDAVEDLAIAYGYNNIHPLWRRLPTTGGATPEILFRDIVREIMLGLGFQEVLTFTMTNPENLFSKMNLKPEKTIEISNPKVQTLTCIRSWLLPSLMEFLSHNTHVEYPQRIFEVGHAIVFDRERESRTRDIEKLVCITIHPNANYTEAKSVMDALFLNLGVEYGVEEAKHASFIDGRTGKVLVNGKQVGIIGEIHPQVLETWKLENPSVAFEVDLAKISETKSHNPLN